MENNTLIYATGVFLKPMQLPSGKWVWVATSFEEDSYYCGDLVDPITIADTEKELFTFNEE